MASFDEFFSLSNPNPIDSIFRFASWKSFSDSLETA